MRVVRVRPRETSREGTITSKADCAEIHDVFRREMEHDHSSVTKPRSSKKNKKLLGFLELHKQIGNGCAIPWLALKFVV